MNEKSDEGKKLAIRTNEKEGAGHSASQEYEWIER